MNDLIVIQLLGAIDPYLDQQEMSLDDIKYSSNGLIQNAILKIKYQCLKFALDNELECSKFKYEISNIVSSFEGEEKEYLKKYAKDLIEKMQRIINPSEIVEQNYENGWHWGDEVSPKR